MSKILKTVKTAARDLMKENLISEKEWINLASMCPEPPKHFSPNAVKKLRVKHELSQEVFAQHLNISKRTLQKWERGEASPTGAGLKILEIVKKHGLKILI